MAMTDREDAALFDKTSATFTRRTRGYKAGLVMLAVVSVVFLLGFVSPFWSTASFQSTFVIGSVQYHEGLWMLCADQGSSSSDCSASGVLGFPAWFQVVRTLECLCVIGLVLAWVHTIATNCCSPAHGHHSRLLEAVIAIAGLLGFAGCMIYFGLREKEGRVLSSFFTVLSNDLTWTFSWAFYLSTVGSVLTIPVAILIAISNKPTPTENSNSMAMRQRMSPAGNLPAESGPHVGPHRYYNLPEEFGFSDPYGRGQSKDVPEAYDRYQKRGRLDPYDLRQPLEKPESYGRFHRHSGYPRSERYGRGRLYEQADHFGPSQRAGSSGRVRIYTLGSYQPRQSRYLRPDAYFLHQSYYKPEQYVKHQSSHAQTDPSHTQRQPSHAQTDLDHTQRQSSHAQTDPGHAQRQSSHAQTDPGHVQRQSSHAQTDPGHAQSQSSHAQTDQGHAPSEHSYTHTDVQRKNNYAQTNVSYGLHNVYTQPDASFDETSFYAPDYPSERSNPLYSSFDGSAYP